MNIRRVPKRYRSLIVAAATQGWGIHYRATNIALYAPDGITIIVVHYTPSDGRAYLNTVAAMRRAGLRFPSR